MSISSMFDLVTNTSSDVSQLKLQEITLKLQLSQINSSTDDKKTKQVKIQVIEAKIQQIQAQIQQQQIIKTVPPSSEKAEPSKDIVESSNISKENLRNFNNNIINIFV
ncbi:FlxA-like family protein [Clostridium sp. FP1]|uniref:FlxA-like family protein n=1 Tax=Clostridium sp. FP1 TaxID=2724076 RepID=UPI0013E8FAA1|nr:FlxA-like family protein [Clostridium sp. FP1]MBZ9634491.1 FlxA-like family protein [Clostridium sp. FP1]